MTTLNHSDISKLKTSTANLEESLKLARETQQMSNDTMTELRLQREQLQNIKGNVDTVTNRVDKSERIIKNIERKWYDPRTWF